MLDTIVESAARLCNARYCYVDLFDGTLLHFKAHYGLPPEAIELIGRTFPMEPGRGTAAARAVATGAVAEIPDMQADAEYEMGALSGMLGSRSTVAAPLLKNGAPIGVITIERLEAGTLPERQIELLKTFADQAVVAIANFRMFEEIQARNRDVTEALEQQTATADVLKTISSSAFDLDAVLHTLVKSASDLCHSGMGYIYLRQGDVLQPTVQIGWSQEFQDHMNNLPVTPGRGSIAARVALSGSVEQIADVLDDPEYTNIEGQRLGGFRTLLGVPLLRDGAVNGVFVLAENDRFAVQRTRNRTGADIFGPGCHRDRECAPVRGSAGQDRGTGRIAAAAVGHRRRVEGDQPLRVRSRGGVPGTAVNRLPACAAQTALQSQDVATTCIMWRRPSASLTNTAHTRPSTRTPSGEQACTGGQHWSAGPSKCRTSWRTPNTSGRKR